MLYTHRYEFDLIDNEIYREYENNEIASEIQYEFRNNVLKIIEFHSGGNDPDYRNGTELLLHLISELNIQPIIIHGTLSTVDAPSKTVSKLNKSKKQVGWIKSMPFYASLPNHLNQRFNTNYKFRLYQGSYYCRINITEDFLFAIKENDLKSYVDKLIAKNQNCSFELYL